MNDSTVLSKPLLFWYFLRGGRREKSGGVWLVSQFKSFSLCQSLFIQIALEGPGACFNAQLFQC